MGTRPEVETKPRQRRVPGGANNFPTRRTPGLEARGIGLGRGALRLTALVELGAISALYAREDLRRAPFDICG